MFKYDFSNIRYRQCLYCIFVLLTVISGNCHSTWTSPYIPQLKSENSPIGVALTTLESSFIVSALNIGYLIGSILTIWAYDLISRKWLLILGAILDVTSWIFIYFAKSFGVLLAGRTLAGISAVVIFNCAVIYNAEISDKDNRGKIGFLSVVFATIGATAVYIFGPYISYGNFAILMLAVCVFSIICVCFIPKSPYFLIKNGKFDEARNSIRKICCDSVGEELIEKQLNEMKKNVEFEMKNKSTMKELLTNKIYYKTLTIHAVLKILMYMSGNYVIKSYMQTIIGYSGGNTSAGTASVIFGVFNMAAVFVSSFLVDKFGKKPLLILSTTLCGICNFILATYFYFLEETSYNLDSISWLPLATLVAFEISVAIALLPLPYMIGAELYPLNIKGVAVSTVSFSVIPLVILLTTAFESVIELWGTFTIFWIFSVSCFLGILFAVFIFPETKGKTFEEIQKKLYPKLYINEKICA